ncbi:MAG: hypothetical protein PWQ12_1941 [Clostridiales bacterium]|nr:hypothetical protein [Clostridiales bacterium]
MFTQLAMAQPLFGMGASPWVAFILLGFLILILIFVAVYTAWRSQKLHKLSDRQAKEIEISNQKHLRVQSELKERERYIQQLQTQLMDQQKQSLEDKEAISKVAYSDELTKLPNRYAFKEQLQALVNHPSKEYIKGAVLFIDFDNFKAINDQYGHTIGDKVLYEVAQRIKDSVGNYGTVYRYESDEFIALIDTVVDSDSIDYLSERIRDAFSEEIVIDALSIALNFSMGIALIPIHGNTFESILSSADNAMYRAKDHHNSSFQFFNA